MKIICESGATKGDWRVIENGIQTVSVQCPGTNVSTMEKDSVLKVIRDAAAKLPQGPYEAVYLYTAGVITDDIRAWVEEALKEAFGAGEVEVQTDLVAAARAACGHAPGIAAIMGTGSSSCFYDGEKIAKRVYSGGYILGDEGSASVLGKLFIADYLKNDVPEEVAKDFEDRFHADYASIVQNVYHNPGSPSGWLGSLCPFILSHYDVSYVKNLVDGNFQAFVDRTLKQYDLDKYPVGIIGGFAYALQHIVRPIFERSGVRIRAFIPSPIEELVKYHA